MRDENNQIVIIGGGLTGLSSGYVLSRAGFSVRVIERDENVGGLSKTIAHNGFRFDLGGHRFFTADTSVDRFVRDIMGDELITVSRSSKILLRNRYFHYPLRPMNAVFGLGLPTTFRIMADYGSEKLKGLVKRPEIISLEDWVVGNFGRTMFNIYFREYSEKVWGIPCERISADWVEKRIRGLSLTTALKNAFFKFSGRDIPTLADRFIYPRLGIGRIADRLREEIEQSGEVSTATTVEGVNHDGYSVRSVSVRNCRGTDVLFGGHYIASMPLNRLVMMLTPPPPARILEAAASLKFRDLVVAAVMVNRPRVTDQTWIYLPEKAIPFGRIHEPTNWSGEMAPEGRTVVVTEFFCSRGDETWDAEDDRIRGITIDNLCRLGFLEKQDVIDSVVVRVPGAYPLFEVGYGRACREISEYLARFRNLRIAGRGGMFRYYNMDHAIRSGMEAAEYVIRADRDGRGESVPGLAAAGAGR